MFYCALKYPQHHSPFLLKASEHLQVDVGIKSTLDNIDNVWNGETCKWEISNICPKPTKHQLANAKYLSERKSNLGRCKNKQSPKNKKKHTK